MVIIVLNSYCVILIIRRLLFFSMCFAEDTDVDGDERIEIIVRKINELKVFIIISIQFFFPSLGLFFYF